MLPSNVLFRTFFVRAAQYGTAFTLDVADSEYLVTARHLIPVQGDQVELQILHNQNWLRASARVVGRGRGDLDIAILKLPSRITRSDMVVTASMGEMLIGQDVFFLGFPYKLWADYGQLTGGLPAPYLKKGTLSSVTMGHPKVLYVDAINNQGFSGGPLYFFKNGNAMDVRIAAVVSGYRTEREPVVDQEGSPTGLSVEYNTGFLVAYGIGHALDIIASGSDA